MLILSVFPGT